MSVQKPDPERELEINSTRVRQIVSERQIRYDETAGRLAALQRSRQDLLRQTREEALRSGSLANVAEFDSYRRRLEKELRKLEADLEEQRVELDRARKRLDATESGGLP